MTKIQFKDLPDRSTPRNATNLNKLNNVSVGTTTPTLDEELWVKESNNVLTKFNYINGFVNGTNGQFTAQSASGQVCIYMEIEPSTTYTITGWVLNTTKALATYSNIPSVGTNSGAYKYLSDASASTTTITSGANDKYLVMLAYTNTYKQDLELIKVIKGTVYSGESVINVNSKGNYHKLTETINVGSESNNAGVWIDYENLFNKNNYKEISGYFNTSMTSISSSTVSYSVYIPITGGKTYTVSKINSTRFNIGTTSTVPAANVAIIDNANNTVSNSDGTPKNSQLCTITTSANAKYLVIWYTATNSDTISKETIRNSIVVQEGNIIQPSVLNVNNNGTYDKLTDTVSVGVYSNNSGLWVNKSKNLCNNIAGSYDIRGNGTYRYGVDLGYLEAGTYYLSRSNPSLTVAVYITEIDGNTYTDNAVSGTEFAFTLTKRVRCIARTTDNTANTWNNGVGKIMVERNNVKTPYEDYINPSIKVNNNGVYETIVNKNIYSTSEVVIGEYMGKPLYRKVYINTGNQQSYAILKPDNLKEIVNMNIMQYADSAYVAQYYWSSSDYLRIFYVNNYIQIRTSKTSYTHTITLEYTKTTD